MDILSFLVASLVVLLAFVVGAAIVMLVHHLELHNRLTERRERDTMVIRAASPRHLEQRQDVSEISYTPAPAAAEQPIPEVPIASRTVPTEEIPKPESVRSTAVPVDVSYAERAATNRPRSH
jgi:hypothetical protein